MPAGLEIRIAPPGPVHQRGADRAVPHALLQVRGLVDDAAIEPLTAEVHGVLGRPRHDLSPVRERHKEVGLLDPRAADLASDAAEIAPRRSEALVREPDPPGAAAGESGLQAHQKPEPGHACRWRLP